MRPGITIQHGTLPVRQYGLVRCDIGAIVSFITAERWPEGASAGDFVELSLRRAVELEDHPLRSLFSRAAARAVRSFFENGGDQLHFFGVCVHALEDLKGASESDGVLVALFDRLRAEDDIALLCLPELAYMRCEVSASGMVRGDADSIYAVFLRHCRQMTNRFLILDAPRGLHGDLLFRWFERFRSGDPETMSYGAVYYPWLQRGDEVYPPSGAVMGTFARTELEHAPFGIAWPPANTSVRGATHTEVELDWAECGRVSDTGINPMVVQPGRGVVIWGARTMSKNPTWTFINSRRIVSMVSEQLRRDNEWAVFEVNDRSLWKIIERDVLVRLDQFWAAGLLSGARSQEEYSVQCNDATNPMALRDAGQLNVQILLRPVGTTERILIDLRLGSSGP